MQFSFENSGINHSEDIDSSKDFRLNNQKFVLTYKGHIDGLDLIKSIENKIDFKVKFIDFANEKKNEWCNYNHTHVIIDFGKRLEKKNGKGFFDFTVKRLKNPISPYIQTIKSTHHWFEVLCYMSKESDTSISIILNLIFEMNQEFQKIEITDYQIKIIKKKLSMITYYISQNKNITKFNLNYLEKENITKFNCKLLKDDS